MREWCWLTSAWWSLKSCAIALWRGAPLTALTLTPVVGHEYVKTEDWDVLARVQVSKCARCGKFSVGWYAAEPVGIPNALDRLREMCDQ